MTLGDFLKEVKDLPLNSEIDKWCPGSGYHDIRVKYEYDSQEGKYLITV